MTRTGERSMLPALAVAAFLGAALSHLPVARALRYAAIAFFTRPASWHLALPLVVLAAFLHEALVRGALYGALRRRVPVGFGAPLAALAGVVAPVAARLWLFPFPAVPWPLVLGQAVVAELPLSLALCLLALGTGRWLPSGFALALLWTARIVVVPTFHGSPVPTLEILASLLAAVVVALVLHGPLTPHREALEGLS
ncbi:MAG: hypothetical protein IPP07_27750 [Holophagales bacterium]|jgi:hypothetical protein|nr:hypothetical protein [Holophagales bacterium]MBK9968451.1 hypothetical protein [Holophagales bacterium]